MRQKVILMIIPNLNFGGAQRVFHNLSVVLSEQYKVVECVFNFSAGHAFKSGNEVLSLDVEGGDNFLSKIWQFYKRCKRLRDLKKQVEADICISHLEGADLVNVLSGGRGKTITWVHGSKRHDQNISGLIGFARQHLLIPLVYAKANCVITVSKEIELELIHYYGISSNRITTIHNYFETRNIVTKSAEPLPINYAHIFSHTPVLIFSGRLAKQKNLEAMLNWFSFYIRTNICKLVIVGDGEMRNVLLKLCSELELKTYQPWSRLEVHDHYEIYFLGFQNNPHQLIKHATIFILPSLWEGFPMALGEAMVCGIPIVSADCPTSPREMLLEDWIEGEVLMFPYFAEYGLLLPLLTEKNYDCWSTGISKLLNDKSLLKRYAEQSIKRGNSFSMEGNSQMIFEKIKSIL